MRKAALCRLFFRELFGLLPANVAPAVEQNSADECDSGCNHPLASPNLNGLPVNQGARRVDEPGCCSSANANQSSNQAHHCPDAQAKLLSEVIEV
jgi:hypothetical protein